MPPYLWILNYEYFIKNLEPGMYPRAADEMVQFGEFGRFRDVNWANLLLGEAAISALAKIKSEFAHLNR